MSSKTRLKTSIFILILAAVAWYFLERNIRQQHSFGGVPVTTAYSLTHWQRVLRNDGFMLGYSEWRKNALWVTYKLNKEPSAQRVKRPKRFETDKRTLARVAYSDYTGSGFDRGHLAPNYALGINYGKAAQYDSFLMTNISPQRSNLNKKLWQRIEELATDHFVKQLGDLWVFTGPVFSSPRQYLPSGVEVPSAFYKIFVTADMDKPATLAFLVPQTVKGNEDLRNFVVSIDEIESATKIDFLHELQPDIETQLESQTNPMPSWKLDKVARLPPRY